MCWKSNHSCPQAPSSSTLSAISLCWSLQFTYDFSFAGLRAGKKAKKDSTATKAADGADLQAAAGKEAAGVTDPEAADVAGGTDVTDASTESDGRKRKERNLSSL